MIQIFGKAKCFDTKKAIRYFKERKIPVQYIDIKQKPMSKGEYRSVKAAMGGWQALVDEKAKEYEDCYLPYLTVETDIDEKILENQQMLKTPMVRNGNKADGGSLPPKFGSYANDCMNCRRFFRKTLTLCGMICII